MRKRVLIFLLLPLLLAACATPGRPVVAPQPYVRVMNVGSNLVQLQIVLRKFVPAHASGPAVWLAGVSHIGDPDYYRALQQHLDARTLVLYEGIGPHPSPALAPGKPEGASPGPARSDLGSLQQTAAESLGLVFQLDAMDYDRPNFRNSDLTVEELQRLLSVPAKGGPAAGEKFDQLLAIMQGDSFLGTLIRVTLKYIGADEKLRGTARLLLIEMLGRLRGDLSELQGVPPDFKRLLQTLIDSRNRKVMSDLKHALRGIPRDGSVAIFYGTGHMDNLEKQLYAGLHYRPVAEEWLTAFSVDVTRSGITPAEVQTIRWFAERQMERLQPPR